MKRSLLLRLLFEKQPARFDSAFGKEESIKRLGRIVKRWSFLPSYEKSLIGIVKSDKVAIHLWQMGAWPPVFYGRFQVENGIVILDGYFAESLSTRIFGAFWFGCVLLFAFEAPIDAIINTNTIKSMQDLLLNLFSSWITCSFLVGVISWSKWLTRNHTKIISQQILSALQPTEKNG